MRDSITPELTRKCTAGICRGCGDTGLAPILDYGPMPPSDGFLEAGRPEAHETRLPLELVFCESCGLLQVLETREPAELFGANYIYLSSCSESWLEHCRDNVEEIISRFDLGADSLVLEVASNDGYLLQYFKQRDIPNIGVDPAPNPACIAAKRGIETVNEFFTHELAKSLSARGRADVVISNNVLAHVADIHDFIRGIKEVLSPTGTWIIEVPYAANLVEGYAFDTVYHEHLCYFTVHSLQGLLARHGFCVNDLKKLQSHGGSLRLFVSGRDTRTDSVTRLLRTEHGLGMHSAAYFEAFATGARAVRDRIAGLLEGRAMLGRRIAAYGAAAKGTILLNCLGAAARHISFVVDSNPLKHGKRVPGVGIPIHPVEEIRRRRPDSLLLLPWNLREEILRNERDFLRSGGEFIVPLPAPEIVSGDSP